MKTFKVLSTVIAVLLALGFSACAAKSADKDISQLRTDILTAACDEYEITAYAEEREIPLAADGNAGVRTPVIIIKASVLNAFSGTYTVKVKFGEKEYSAQPELRSENFMRAVIPVENLPEGDIEVTLSGDKVYSAVLKSCLPQGVSGYEKAVQTAKVALADKLSYEGSGLNGELFVRVLCEGNSAYWYVGYVTENNIHSVLIAADGVTVIATKDQNNNV